MLATLCSIGWLAVFLPFCTGAPPAPLYSGYIEGERVLIAPREAGRIVVLHAKRGDMVQRGAALFAIEDEDAKGALAAARAQLARFEAEHADLQQGKRPQEIAVTRAQLAEAEAAQREARGSFARQQALNAQNVISVAGLDSARAALERADARAAMLRRQIDVEEMAGRDKRVEAAARQVEAQRALVAQAQWRLDQHRAVAPQDALVEDVLRRPGEMAGPDAPVVSLLPPENRILRFYVPQARRARFSPGMQVALTCDGCAQGLRARISYVAAEPEFTPPVIYSVGSREKLVYLIEARPLGDALALNPGQPVDVSLVADSRS